MRDDSQSPMSVFFPRAGGSLLQRRFRAKLLAVSMIVGLGSTSRAGSPEFHGLGDLPGGPRDSSAIAVSGDGQIIVGRSMTDPRPPSIYPEYEAVYWIYPFLSPRPLGSTTKAAHDASYDGGVIVGTTPGLTPAHPGKQDTFRWVRDIGLEYMTRDPLAGHTLANGVSPDGSVAVGHRELNYPDTFKTRNTAFRWDALGVTNLPDSGIQSVATAITRVGDEEIIVGRNHFSQDAWTAVIWRDGVMQSLGDLPGGGDAGYGEAVSANGKVVVGGSMSGQADPDWGAEAFRWTEKDGMKGLGDLSGGRFGSYASGVSGNGMVIVGNSATSRGNEAMIWTPATGMQHLGGLLDAGFGLDLGGWTLEAANDVSEDGFTIVGSSPRLGSTSIFWTQGMTRGEAPRWKFALGQSSFTIRTATERPTTYCTAKLGTPAPLGCRASIGLMHAGMARWRSLWTMRTTQPNSSRKRSPMRWATGWGSGMSIPILSGRAK